METINKNFFSWLLVTLFVFLGFFFIRNNFSENPETNKINSVKIAGKIIKVDLALTQKDQAQGLSDRSELKEDEGMLFIFDREGRYAFWMKDMNFPIDIIWVAGEDFKNLRVVYIKKNALPESYPETFAPTEDSRYVLEVISSFSEKNNLKEGDKVEFLSF